MTHTKVARLLTETLSVNLRVTLPLAIAVVALLVPSPATAGIISTTGNAKVETELTQVGAIRNFSQNPDVLPPVHGWTEQQSVVLSQDIYIDNRDTYFE
jgi:hypothetical protein